MPTLDTARVYPGGCLIEKTKLPIDLPAGGDGIRRAIERGVPLARIERSWRPALLQFARARQPYLLYA